MIENTSKRDPMVHLLGAMSDGPSAYIEGMEAAGQRQVVGSDKLPTRSPWGELEELGFRPGAVVDGDPLFRHVTLPDGWSKAGSDHSMWSYVVDGLGRRRVAVFYKAAWYDREAFAHLQPLSAYIGAVAAGEEALVVDDVWATVDAVRAVIEREAAGAEEQATRFEEVSMADAAARSLDRAERIRAVLSLLPEVKR